MRRLGGLLLAGWITACARGPEPAPLQALCGEEAPTLALATGGTQVLTEAPLRIGARALYTTAEPLDRSAQQATLQYGPTELGSAGACGEAPRRVGALERPELRARWPGVALACDPDRGQIVAVDPASSDEPRALYDDCGLAWSAHGRISLGGPGEREDFVFLHPDPLALDSGPAAPMELLGPVQVHPQPPRSLQVTDDLVFALTPDDSVVSIDLRTREVTLEQTGVRYFYVSADGRYLLWQGLAITGGPEASVTRGPVVLSDRERGVGIGLGETGLGYSTTSLKWADQGVMVLTVGTYQQIYRLPDLEVVDVPEGLVVDPLGPVDDHRWLLRGPWNLETHVIDFTTGVSEPLFLGSTVMIGRDAEVAWLIEMQPCCEDGGFADEGAVWRTPLDGSQPRPIGDRASRYFARVGGQLVTVVDIDADYLGSLLRVDLATGAEDVVDDRVFATSLQADAQTGIVSYSRIDGERSGVWQLQLPLASTSP